MRPPAPDDLRAIARRYHFELSDGELEAFADAIGQALGGYARLDELVEEPLPVRYPRAGVRPPAAAGDAYHGWAWRCSIRGAADGPLRGRTVAIKDNVAVAGVPLLNGSAVMEGFVPREDATVVTRLLDAGAEILGKSAAGGLCYDGSSVDVYPRNPVNPHDPARVVGGSSGGSAVLLVAGEVDLAIGGDQGGSIRNPASWCGVVGLKPTWGLVPYTGAISGEPVMDHLGPMARTVADCAAMLQVIAGPDGLDPRQRDVRVGDYASQLDAGAAGLRVGILGEGFGWPESEPDVDDVVRAAARRFATLGAEVVDVSVPEHLDAPAIAGAIYQEGTVNVFDLGGLVPGARGHHSVEHLDFFSRAWGERAADLPDLVKVSILLGHWASTRYGRRYYAKAVNLTRTLAAAYDRALARVDVLVLPTTVRKAPTLPEPGDLAARLDRMGNVIHNTAAFNATGHPALSIPCGWSEGLPVGMQLVGRRWDEALLLRAAAAFEGA